MNFTIQREALLKPLQTICGVVERRQTLPILSHVLIQCDGQKLTMTTTDLEVEMVASAMVEACEAGETTLPARKFMDICRTLPEGAKISLAVEGERAILRAGKSRFTLSTLPAGDFPNIEAVADSLNFSLPQRALKSLIDHTAFAMAQQDVRYYLNGLMLELDEGVLRSVATDGHRLAMCEQEADLEGGNARQIILPRKGVTELARLLEEDDTRVKLEVGNNHLRLSINELIFTSKLIDGKFPDYQRVLPQKPDKLLVGERELLRQALARASILSNEKYRGIRLLLDTNALRIVANNPEQEEAEEEIEVEYGYDALEIGFNVNYILDALNTIANDKVQIAFSDSNSSCLITAAGETAGQCKYVVMPMRL
ncbi:DNA polymerase III subunit beta [Sulfuriflexus mobilis]|uniref:DNA polymerase III subunit beta n=1 Tax=Sulfuriflexus mobilis TaxID=1811807 RepID=UPI000F823372|nr:DNA polymerase III subunit beta [Sulfuriflexus mobilis]